MNRQAYHQLLAERGTLEQLVAETPADEVIDLRSLQVRLETVNRLIGAQPQDKRLPSKARLTYRGRPVIGSYGVYADFGMSATKAFTDTVSMLAASYEVPLVSIGPIPNRRQNQLLITSTALGSFGFELEEHRDDTLALEEEESPVARALMQTQDLLQGAATGSDDDLTDAASGHDERVIAAARTFLKTLIDHEAVCGLTVKDRAFSFRDVGEVRRSFERLSQDNIHEDVRALEGEFIGALPHRRTFEFRLSGTHEIIVGKMGPGIILPEQINAHLYASVRIEVLTTQVGQGRPRYVLGTLPDWQTPA